VRPLNRSLVISEVPHKLTRTLPVLKVEIHDVLENVRPIKLLLIATAALVQERSSLDIGSLALELPQDQMVKVTQQRAIPDEVLHEGVLSWCCLEMTDVVNMPKGFKGPLMLLP
jgi:hypothetical protein